MIAEAIDARPYHIGQLSRSLRTEHRSLLAGMQVNIHREMRSAFDASTWAKAWFVDGQLQAVGGVTGTLGSSEATVWLAVSQDAMQHPLPLCRAVQQHLNQMLATRLRLRTLVMKRDRPSVRFAYFLGFRVEKAETVNGAEALTMICERQGVS